MRRIVYLCPNYNAPVGGIKVIYQHVEALNRLGVPAFVLHPAAPQFRCDWFPHEAQFLSTATLDPARDFVIIPEIWVLEFGLRCLAAKVPYAIFVQNGYKLYPEDPEAAEPIRSIMLQAELVLSISADTEQMIALNVPGIDPTRLMRVKFAIPRCFVAEGANPKRHGDKRLITFMPRKLPLHTSRIVHALRTHLPPRWDLQPIDGLGETDCADLLKRSCIFLAISEFEGLALSPAEAALAGNVVIGYTGQGSKEYWAAPNFQVIEPGNILGFVAAVLAAAAQIDAGGFARDVLWPGIAQLAGRFSSDAQAMSLAALSARIAACP